MTLFAILLALIAFSPTQTMAKGPGGGGGDNHSAGAHASGEHHVGVGAQQNGDQQGGVGGNADINPAMHSNMGNIGGQAAAPHQAFDAHHHPEYSGGNGEGRDNGRYRWNNGHWWFWGANNQWMLYGDNGQWQPYGNAYVVQRPILEEFSGGPIKIVNPAKTGVTLTYTLDGTTFTMPPGYSQTLQEDRAWVIQFSRGANLNQARYGLQSGVYKFVRTDHGVELYHSGVQQTVAPPPPMAARPDSSQR
jgi:hypothetical protein